MGRDGEVLENMGRGGEVLENMGRDREVGENLEPAFSSLPPMWPSIICKGDDQWNIQTLASQPITQNAPNVDFRMDPCSGFNRITQDKKFPAFSCELFNRWLRLSPIRSLAMLVSNSLTHSLTDSLPFSKLEFFFYICCKLESDLVLTAITNSITDSCLVDLIAMNDTNWLMLSQ